MYQSNLQGLVTLACKPLASLGIFNASNKSESSQNIQKVTTATAGSVATTATLSFTTPESMSTLTPTNVTTTVASTCITSSCQIETSPITNVCTATGTVPSQGSLPEQVPLSQHAVLQETVFLEGLQSLLAQQLPKLDIEKFDGDRKKYDKFKCRFCTLITSCNVIPSQRATLLYNALTDSVIDLLDPICDLQKSGAYDELWHSLDNEYSQTYLDVISHVSKLSSIQGWEVCETSDDLYKLYKFIRYHHNALKRHGQEWQAEVSKLHVLGKLTGSVKDKCFDLGLFEMDNSKPVLSEMLSLIRKEVDILKLQEIAKETVTCNMEDDTNSYESSSEDEGYLSSYSKPEIVIDPCHTKYYLPPPSKTKRPLKRKINSNVSSVPIQTLYPQVKRSGVKSNCMFCQSYQHDSHRCKHYHDPSYYRKFLFRDGLCFNCFEQGHRSSECIKHHMCAMKCEDERKHSSVLCQSV